MPCLVNPTRMVNQTVNQYRFADPDQHVVGAVMIADFLDNVRSILRIISGRVEGPDEGNGFGVREAVELFVQVWISHPSRRHRYTRRQIYGPKSSAQTLCPGEHGNYGAIGVWYVRITLQGHSHINIPAMRPEQLLSQPPVAEIVGDPVNCPTRRNSFNLLGQ